MGWGYYNGQDITYNFRITIKDYFFFKKKNVVIIIIVVVIDVVVVGILNKSKVWSLGVWVAREMCKGCRGDVQGLPGRCGDMGKQSQLLLQPTEVELGLQVGVEFDIIK